MHDTHDSDYIFYADESGDHSLTSIDPQYPVFALSLCMFKKSTYCRSVVPNFQRLKFDYFGHDAIVLHEHDIRKQNGPFKILTNANIRSRFLNDLSICLEKSSFKIFGVVILKNELTSDFFPENPYSLSLKITLQQAYLFLKRRKQEQMRTHFIFEKRGAKEDTELELEFRRIVGGVNDIGVKFESFEIHFSDKKSNSTGMQIADLTARPLGLSISRPHQANRAFEIVASKIFKSKKFSFPSRGIYTP
ncbi:DUF3800 domain-containing protein [Ahrensia marina]|uniref:DUF3800 domain-containing protein n=1 Tax=Ahrensia marina TaxID=1514904 RepID=UPI0009E7040D|nr:DUF3800 domain-containing protein [Ahrensia marina]